MALNTIPLNDEDYNILLSLGEGIVSMKETPVTGTMVVLYFKTGLKVDAYEVRPKEKTDTYWYIAHKTLHLKWMRKPRVPILCVSALPPDYEEVFTRIVHKDNSSIGIDRLFVLQQLVDIYKCRLGQAVYWLLLADTHGITSTIVRNVKYK